MRSLAVGLVALALTAPAAARADALTKVAEGLGYGIPSVAGAMTTTVNGTALAYDTSPPRGWRTAGYIAGGVDVCLGTGLLIWHHDGTANLVFGGIPLVLGVGSLTTSLFVKTDAEALGVSLAPLPLPDGGGLAIAGSF